MMSAIMLSTTVFAVSAADVSNSVSATPDEAQEQTNEGYCDGFYYKLLDDGTAEITEYDGTATDLVVPDYINGYIVTSIRNNTFESKYLKNVTIGEHINHIGETAFKNGGITIVDDNGNQVYDYILENIYVNKSNKHFFDIDGVLFSNDTHEILFYPSNNSIEYLVIPNGIEKVIIGGALKEIYIPFSVENIVCLDGSSNGGRNLERITVSQDNQTYCSVNGVLYSKNMTELLWIPEMSPIENYTIPETVTEIKCTPFSTNMKSLSIHKDFTQSNIDYMLSCVTYYENMENFFVDNDNPYYCSIDGILYWQKPDLYRKTLFAYPPSNKTNTFKIPDDTTLYMNRNELNNAKYLENLILPKSMKHFADYSVNLIKSLKNILVEDGNEQYISIDGVLYSKDTKTLLCYPIGRVENSYDIPNGVTTVSSMMSTVYLRDVSFPKTIKKIDGLLGYESSNSRGINAQKIDDYIIRGYTNSTAETYAKKNGFTFISLGTINKLGDSNSDGVVNIIDATTIQRYLAEYEVNFSENEKITSDTNADGYITISDVTEIQRFIADLPSAMNES